MHLADAQSAQPESGYLTKPRMDPYCCKRFEETEYGAYEDHWNGIYETHTMVVESAMSSLATNYHQQHHQHHHQQYHHHLHHHQNHHYHHPMPQNQEQLQTLNQQQQYHSIQFQPQQPQPQPQLQQFQQVSTEDNNLVWSSVYDRGNFNHHHHHHLHHQHHHQQHNGYHSFQANNVQQHQQQNQHHPTTPTTLATTTIAAANPNPNPNPINHLQYNGLVQCDSLTNRSLEQTDYGQCTSLPNLGNNNGEDARFNDNGGRYYPMESNQQQMVEEPAFTNDTHPVLYDNTTGGNALGQIGASTNDVSCCITETDSFTEPNYLDMNSMDHTTAYSYDAISNGYDVGGYRNPHPIRSHQFHYPMQHQAADTDVNNSSSIHSSKMQTRSSSKYKLMTKLSEHITIKKHNFTTDVYQIKHNAKICKHTKTLFSETKHIHINRLTTRSIRKNSTNNPKIPTGNRSSIPASPSILNKYNLCYICGKNYARPSTLKTHLRTHSGEKPYRCQMCNKAFSQAANLTAHTRIHSGEKPFPCPVCQRRFSQSSSVTTHLRTHSGERPYCCTFCSKSFSDSSTLTKHLRIHSGEKPYQCGMCFLSFSQSGNLNRHMRIHI